MRTKAKGLADGDYVWARHTPIVDALEAQSPAMRAAYDRVEWRHFAALMQRGIPAKELINTFGVVTVQGREMVVTESPRLRAFLTGATLHALADC